MEKIGKLKLSAILIVILVSLGLIWSTVWRPHVPSNNSSIRSQDARNDELKLRAMQVSLPYPSAVGGFIGSTGCRDCHRERFESWHGTFHRTMTQVATTETVVAPFSNVILSARNRNYLLTKEGDSFFATMPDPDWEAGALANGVDIGKARPPTVKLQVVLTTGSHHMQEYWVSSSVKNLLRQIPWVYLISDRRWVPREDIFLSPPNSPRHFAVWNDNCVACHAVAGVPNFDLEKMSVATHVAELGISCEAC
ncbi:MAG TPA: hypothetical protein VM260_02735, partial [Pirellula sp.]|nr:hypothetical protein [Pirellula sp.]